MNYKNDKEIAIELVETYGPLTINNLTEYFRIMKDKDAENIEHMIKTMVDKNQLFSSGDIIKGTPGTSIDTKNIVAFWTLLAFIKDIEGRMFKAKYPSQIGFVKDQVCIITVCEDQSQDKEMISLREKMADDVTHIIAGLNLELEDINKAILPNGKFIYAKVELVDITGGIPKISFTPINNTEV